jgi:uncharacterized phiE125 gp8 family phage protein
MYSLSLVTAPTEEPITLAEAKHQLGIATAITYHDDELGRLIKAARKDAEEKTHRQILTATWELNLERFPAGSGRIYLPLPPLQSVTSVKYYDTDGDQQTVAETVYKVLTGPEPGEVALKQGQVWPTDLYDEAEPITIRFVAGYADTAAELADTEELLKAGLLLLIEGMWKRDHGERAYEWRLRAANDILERYAPGDEFIDYG